jgi:hypothetical protein
VLCLVIKLLIHPKKNKNKKKTVSIFVVSFVVGGGGCSV